MFKNLQQQASYIKRNFENAEISENIQFDNLIIYVDRKYLLSLLTFLRDDTNLSFKTLLDIFGADMLQIRSPRFEVIYNLLSYKLNNRITVKVALNDQEKVTTSSTIFSSAGWYEREVFDMYGIEFEGHQDMRRILTDYDFEGYPLRKDFPLTGYKEVRYDENEKKVIYEPVKLMQEFRNFDFEMPWEGTKYHISKDEKK
jgi:NADH-quinone oxidoreductase subunit C